MSTITYNGTWSGRIATDKAIIELDRFVVKDSGEHVVYSKMTSSNFGGMSFGINIVVNDTIVAQGQNFAAPYMGSIDATWTGDLSPGDVVVFEWLAANDAGNGSFSWTIDATPATVDPGPGPDPEPGDGSLLSNAFSVEDIDMIYFGADEADALYKGTLLVWEALRGPLADVAVLLDFDNASVPLQNTGNTSGELPVMTASGSITHDLDHAIFGENGRIFASPDSPWRDGYTLSMWTRDTPAGSGWKTIMHRAMPTGDLTNEAYIVHNTGSTTETYSGLKFGSTHREYVANHSLPVGVDWFHTVVVWERTSTTSFQCRFYINGVSRGVFNATGYASNTQFGSEQLYIGGNRSFGEWSGRMDDLAMWNRALSTEEAIQLYEMGRSALPRITTTELADFKFNDYYFFTLAADFPVDSWTATGLPSGITMSQHGTLSGTPNVESSGTMTVTASGGGKSTTATFQWEVKAGVVWTEEFSATRTGWDNFATGISTGAAQQGGVATLSSLSYGGSHLAYQSYQRATIGDDQFARIRLWNPMNGNLNLTADPLTIRLRFPRTYDFNAGVEFRLLGNGRFTIYTNRVLRYTSSTNASNYNHQDYLRFQVIGNVASLINETTGVTLVNFTIPAGTVQTGPNYRYLGMAMEGNRPWFQVQWGCYSVASLEFGDA